MTLARYLRCISAVSPLCLRCISAGAEIDDPQGRRGCAGSGRQHSAGPPRCRRDVAEISRGTAVVAALTPACRRPQGRTEKPAVLETGAEIMVPMFIKEGEEIKVDTDDRKYLGRAT